MAERKSPRRAAGHSQSILVKGHAAGIVQVAGSRNVVRNSGSIQPTVPPEILKSLLAIEKSLAAHPATKALAAAALQEAKSGRPNKEAIGSQLKTALEVAKTALGWADIAKKLAPHVSATASWLGSSWTETLQV